MDVLLEEHDSVWQELWYLHIADVYKRLDEKVTNFKSKNKAAQIHGSSWICFQCVPKDSHDVSLT